MHHNESLQLKPPIALVDDEPLIIMDIATCAENAFAFLLEHPDLQLLFTDIETRGSIEGLELAREVLKLCLKRILRIDGVADFTNG